LRLDVTNAARAKALRANLAIVNRLRFPGFFIRALHICLSASTTAFRCLLTAKPQADEPDRMPTFAATGYTRADSFENLPARFCPSPLRC